MVKDINPTGAGSAPSGFVGVGTSTYFEADDGTHGQELYKTDSTATGTSLVKDIAPGSNGSYPSQLIDLNGKALFEASSPNGGLEPWISDGTAAGTTLLKDIDPDSSTCEGNTYLNSSFPNGFTVLGKVAIFSAQDGVSGVQLWSTDGTTVETTLLKDIYPGTHYYPYGPNPGQVPNNAYPGGFVPFQGKLFFAATDANGRELWETDGTAAGTTLVKDINPGVAASTNPYTGSFAAVNGLLLFYANDGVHGPELDGVTARPRGQPSSPTSTPGLPTG